MDLAGLGHVQGVLWTGTTDALGQYDADVRDQRSYLVVAWKEGYLPEYASEAPDPTTADIIVLDGDTTGVDFTLAPVGSSTASVSGDVKTDGGYVVSRVIIFPRPNGTPTVTSRSVSTDADGTYDVANVEPGTYYVQLAALTALLISFLIGPVMIRKLAEHQVGQGVRSDGPQTHLTKAGTPTMGGALILVAITVATLLWADLSNRFVWITLAVTIAFGLIGFWDDYLKLVVGNSRGLIARYKYFWQSVAGLGAAIALYVTARSEIETTLIVPFFKDFVLPLGPLYIVLAYFVIVGSSNAVNLTDGLDGLAITFR